MHPFSWFISKYIEIRIVPLFKSLYNIHLLNILLRHMFILIEISTSGKHKLTEKMYI